MGADEDRVALQQEGEEEEVLVGFELDSMSKGQVKTGLREFLGKIANWSG